MENFGLVILGSRGEVLSRLGYRTVASEQYARTDPWTVRLQQAQKTVDWDTYYWNAPSGPLTMPQPVNMNAAPEPEIDVPESYSAYLERTRLQEQRDRDRFLGIDSHENDPMYAVV